MINNFYIKKILFLVLSMIALTGSLNAYFYEDQYRTSITKCWSKVYPSNSAQGQWRTVHFFNLDNDMWATRSKYFKYEYQAQDWAENGCYAGHVNIVYQESSRDDNFLFVLEEYGYSISLNLWFEDDFPFYSLPKIRWITENVNSYGQYNYVIELDDGSMWQSKNYQKRQKMWELGTAVCIIGNGQKKSFVNTSEVRKESFLIIENRHVMDDLRPL